MTNAYYSTTLKCQPESIMILAFINERRTAEKRAPLIPPDVKRLIGLGATVRVESGIGLECQIPDRVYVDAGAEVSADRASLHDNADAIFRINGPNHDDLALLTKGQLHVSLLDPYRNAEQVDALAATGATGVSLEMIPRSTRAQKMDVLSSQASLAGYQAVIEAASSLDMILPMMMTPAGTIKPARFFIIGAGVAGLQAIATAKRLGARVEAYDTRPVVEEQVQSLGAKFVKIDVGETGQTKDGYAKPLSPEQVEIQQQQMAKFCAQADAVITTAQLFGRPAPRIITEEMVAGMKPGSVVVDLAASTGGNAAGTVAGEITNINGVKLIGYEDLPGRVTVHASQMFSANLFHFISEFWDEETKSLKLDEQDEIISACVVCRDGAISNERILDARQKETQS